MTMVEDYLTMNEILTQDDGVNVFKSIQKHNLGIEDTAIINMMKTAKKLPSEAITAMVLADVGDCEAISSDIIYDKVNKIIKLTLHMIKRYENTNVTTVRDLINMSSTMPDDETIKSFVEHYESKGISEYIPYLNSVDLTEDDVVNSIHDVKYSMLNSVKDSIEIAAIVESLALSAPKKTIDLSVLSTLAKTLLNGGKIPNNFIGLFGKLEDEEDGVCELEIHGGFSVTDFFMSKHEKAYYNELKLDVQRSENGLCIKESTYEKDVSAFFPSSDYTTKDLGEAIKLYNAACPDESNSAIYKGIFSNTDMINNIKEISMALNKVDENTISKVATEVMQANDIMKYDALKIISTMLEFVEGELITINTKLSYIRYLTLLKNIMRKNKLIMKIYTDMIK